MEVARLLDIPGGAQIVKESYAQMRKFNCWNISIVQQYSRFKESRIRSAVFGNSRQFFLMRQNDRSDLRGGGREWWRPTSLDPLLHAQYFRAPMKSTARKLNRKAADKPRPRMTRELAEARAVGGGKGKFDGVAFLRTLKK